jgi:integrase
MPLEPISQSDAVELYLQEKSNELAQATMYAHRSRLNHFLEWCEGEGVDNCNDLTGRKLHEFRLWRRGDGDLAPASEKTQMDTLRVFIRWCEAIDAVPVDLSTKVVSPSLSRDDNTRDVMIDAEVAEGILDYLDSFEYASERHVCFTLMWRGLLRRGAVRALDIEDYDSDDGSIDVHHRPETGTPLKNKERGERFVALDRETCEVIDDWLATRRPDVTDEHGREPLLATPQGRPHQTTIQTYVYSVTQPCVFTGDCPHGRKIAECDAAAVRSSSSKCPSSLSPHAVRRGAITHWLSSDVPENVVSDRANVSADVLDEHYDRRTEREKMEQRRRYLDQV